MNATSQGYQACLFHPNLGNEAVGGTLFIERGLLRFQSPEITEEIPLDEVTVEMEKGGERVCFKVESRPELKLFTSDDSILKDRSFAAGKDLRARVTAEATRRELSHRLRVVLYFFIGCVLVTWLGSLATSAMVRSLVARVPPEWEAKFGEAKMEELRSEGAFLDDSNQVACLAMIAAPLMQVVPAAKTGITFHIQNDDDPNAFALPGGHVIVNTGLLRMVDKPEELLGVIAHELAHVSEKHIARHLISSAGPLVMFGVFMHSRNGVLSLLGAGSGLMIAQGFSQEYETEADEVGWNYLVAANIDPRGMISVFRKFQAYEAEQKFASHLPQAFSSHPALAKRISRLEAKWKRLPNKLGFTALTNAIPKFEQDPTRESRPKFPKR